MIYLDYSATTYPDKKVLDEFNLSAEKYIGNPNSSHSLGIINKKRIDIATDNIRKVLNIDDNDIIYTSGSSEANNLAIKGICAASSGKHIITTTLEHSSIIAPINRLCSNGYDVSFVKLNDDGTINIDDLRNIIRDDTVLVCITAVDSELGIRENIEEVAKLLKNYPNCYFHVDATQMIGKTYFDLKDIDTVSFSSHKFFGIKGIGCLVKRKNVKIIPQIDGGNSTTKYRSGTPALELILSQEKALNLAYKDFSSKLKYINELNKDLKKFLNKYPDIKINSTNKSIDQIINFSMDNSEEMIEKLNEKGVYLSTKSACSNKDTLSKTVLSLYKDEKRAANTIRISISYVTTKNEIEEFKKIFDLCYKERNKI